MRRIPILVLALGALGALAGSAAAQTDPAQAPEAVAQSSPAGTIVAPGVVLPRLEDLAATRERPLFSPTRRPPPPPPPPPPRVVVETVVEEPEPEPEQPPPLVLAGVVTGSALTIAMLQNRDTAEVQRVRRGEEVLGWTVTEVGTTHVLLERDGRTVRLALFEKKDEPAADAGSGSARSGFTAGPDDEDEEEEDEDDEDE